MSEKNPTTQLINTLSDLISEGQNPDSMDIDLQDSLDILRTINAEDQKVAAAVAQEIGSIAEAVDRAVDCIRSGGRLVYIGAGTSGRMGVLDAVECVPTFSVPEDLVIAIMAGGTEAMFRAQEGVEDDPQAAIEDLNAIQFNNKDILVGIAASGRTPYVIGALKYAQQVGAQTVALSCNPNAEIAAHADLAILPVVGPEVLSGSTRMKSGTAQKLVLNMLSTATMIRLGKTFRNLMVDLKASNEKLYARGTRMIMQLTDVSQEVAESALTAANLKVKTALYMVLTDTELHQAEADLEAANGFLRAALQKRGL